MTNTVSLAKPERLPVDRDRLISSPWAGMTVALVGKTRRYAYDGRAYLAPVSGAPLLSFINMNDPTFGQRTPLRVTANN